MMSLRVVWIAAFLTLATISQPTALIGQRKVTAPSSPSMETMTWDDYTIRLFPGGRMGRVTNARGAPVGSIVTVNGELQINPVVQEPEASKLRKSFEGWKASRAGAKPTAQPVAPSTAAPTGTSVDQVIAMLEAGISEDLILARLHKENKSFDLTADDMIRLKKAKASDSLLKTMMDERADAKTSATIVPATSPGPEARPASGANPAVTQSASETTPAPAVSSPARSSSRLRKMLDFTKDTVKESATGGKGAATGQLGPKAIDTAGLRNILPDYDPTKPLAEQFPHVALTVLRAPAMWANTYFTVGRGATGYFNGCFTLKAVVWADADHSKTVGPFDWCSPTDVEIQPGPRYFVSNKPPVKESFSKYLTGMDRSEGPRPPATLLPTDRGTQELQMKNNSRGSVGNLHRASVGDLNMDYSSRLTLMFANVRKGMGQTLGDSGDFRVWLVRIEP